MKVHPYFWRGLDAQMRPVQGEIEATSPPMVRHLLLVNGIEITHCERLPAKPKFKPVTPAQVQSLTAQLASLMQSGIPLLQALDFAAQGLPQPALASLLQRVKGRVESGLSLHLALAAESCFDRSEIQLIRAGEVSGNLELMLTPERAFAGQTGLASKSSIGTQLSTGGGRRGFGSGGLGAHASGARL